MPIQMKSEWLTALRSEQYTQAKFYLENFRTGAFCCLGVYCRVLNIPHRRDDEERCVEYKCGTEFIPWVTGYPEAGIGGLTDEQISKLAEMNDSGYTFSEIADWIEANL